MRSWLLLLISASAAAAHAAPPARVEIRYDVVRNGLTVAEAVDRFEHADGRYRLTQVSRGRGIFVLRGSIKRKSEGTIGADGLRPLHFSDERTGRPDAQASFDWAANKLTQQYRGEPRTDTMPLRAHDRLAFLYDFVFAGQAPKGEVSFHLADGRGMSHHVYTVNGRERLKTPAGEFETVKMFRTHEGDRSEIWLALDRSNLPVRVLVVYKDGTRVETVATKISSP